MPDAKNASFRESGPAIKWSGDLTSSLVLFDRPLGGAHSFTGYEDPVAGNGGAYPFVGEAATNANPIHFSEIDWPAVAKKSAQSSDNTSIEFPISLMSTAGWPTSGTGEA